MTKAQELYQAIIQESRERTAPSLLDEARKATPLNDVQKKEEDKHRAWTDSIPHVEKPEHEGATMGGGHTSFTYMHAKNIPKLKAHLEKQGFKHSVEHLGSGLNHHKFTHPEGHSLSIRHESGFPQHDKDTEVRTHSPITKNASKPGTRPGATKAARASKQAAWNARYD
jgi:hypothetical protein